ncbi:MAG: MFS transporter [Desulfuromonadales bacterium]|nr:MFS transporter [Desulfuromonadales bacterium]
MRVFPPFALGYFISYLYRTVNAIIAPDLSRDIGLDPASLGLLTSAYLLAFGLFQLPLGILLDRFGPRRVEATLLLIAAAGALIFSQSTSLFGLVTGRALIGLGVSACLMAAFKSFAIWFPADRLPLANSIQMISGGIGAMVATTPVEMALKITDWRTIFLIFSLVTLLTAAAIFWIVPDQKRGEQGETLGDQLRGIRTVLCSRFFWCLAPLALTTQAAYLSILGLWSGPWLRDVAGLQRDAVASTLFAVTFAMIIGYLASGGITDRLSRRGIEPMTVGFVGMFIFICVQGVMLFPNPVLTTTYWLAFSLFGSFCILPYAVLSQHFPIRLSGRATTTLNLLVFIAAFSAQWGIGVIINQWPETETGGYALEGYQASFGLLFTLQILAAGWYLFLHRQIKSGRAAAQPDE